MERDDLTSLGRTIGGRYVLGEVVSRGGAGTVWRARDLHDGREVALKILHREVRDEKKLRDRFGREAAVLLALDHPNIARAFAFDLDGKTPFVALELVPGESLEVELGRRAARTLHFEEEDLLELLEGVALAVEHAHAAGVIHRDLKPANILTWSEEGARRVKLVDFGVARLLFSEAEDATTQGRLLGTLGYMAPEQALAEPADERADVFALGVIAFELLTLCRTWARDDGGRPLRAYAEPVPFNRYNAAPSLLARIVEEERPRPSSLRPELPAAVDQTLGQVLARDPAQRFRRAGAFVDALRASLAEGRGARARRAHAGVEARDPSELLEDTPAPLGPATATDLTLPPRGAPAPEGGGREPTRRPPVAAAALATIAIAAATVAALVSLRPAVPRAPPRAPREAAPQVSPREGPSSAEESARKDAAEPSPRAAHSGGGSGGAQTVGEGPVERGRPPSPPARRRDAGARPRDVAESAESAEGARGEASAGTPRTRELGSCRRALADLRTAPAASALGALAERLVALASEVDDHRARARVTRLARSSAAIGDVDGVEDALDLLESLEAEPRAGARAP